jgi:hypothetical protein
MNSEPNYDEFEKGTLERVCVDTIERLESNYGVDMKFIVIGITGKFQSLCTSPMSQSEVLHHLKQSKITMSTATPSTESTNYYVNSYTVYSEHERLR